MPETPTLDAYRLEVLADRLSLRERIEQSQGRQKEQALAWKLLSRHPEIGDRIAVEITREVFERWPCCLRGLEELADHLLELRGDEIFLRSEIPLRLPRSLLDEDQLIAARVAALCHERGRSYTNINPWHLLGDPIPPALDRDLEDLLERPLAETHIHLGGAAPPITFWLPLMLGLVSVEVAGRLAARASAEEERETCSARSLTDLWIARLLESAILRLRLAACLSRLSADHPFRRIQGLQGPEGKPSLPETNETEIQPWIRTFREALDRVGYRTPHDPMGPPLEGCPIWIYPQGEIPYRDYLTQAVETELGLSAPSEAPALGERYLLASAFRFLRSAGGDREGGFGKDLLRYIRIKHALLRLLVHYPGIHGLDRYRRSHQRHKEFRRRYDPSSRSQEVWLRASIRYQVRATVIRWLGGGTRQRLLPQAPTANSPGHRAREPLRGAAVRLERRLELRLSPARGRQHGLTLLAAAEGVGDALRALRRVDPNDADRRETPLPDLQFGLVLHLHKSRRIPAVAYAEMLRGVLLWLDDHPKWHPFILGADVAGSELDSPPSRFALAYAALSRWRSPYNLGSPSYLGKTFHVGEDCRDLLTGIRQVDMAIDLLDLRIGDRLGHALAVGFDVEQWYRLRGRRSFPQLGDHLVDLLWARELLLKKKRKDGKALDLVESRLQACGVQPPDYLARTWRDWLGQVRAANATRPPSEEEEQLQERLLEEIGKAASSREELIEVNPDAGCWIEALRTLQERVIRRINRTKLFVEANPTSNLLISGLNDFIELPLFHLHPVRLPTDGTRRLRLSISTDDPEVFRVNLREEYAALFQAAAGTGLYRPSEILEWLDRLRSDSFESSFLNRSSFAREELLSYLEGIAPRKGA